jgi:hypothetical protein
VNPEPFSSELVTSSRDDEFGVNGFRFGVIR